MADNVVAERRREQHRVEAMHVARHDRRQRRIAGAPERLRAQQHAALVLSESPKRAVDKKPFDLSTAVVRQESEHVDTITPRNVKARYVNALRAADRAARVPRSWTRTHTRGLEDTLPVITTPDGASTSEVSNALHTRSAARAARRGIPPIADFTALSEAISAVVASSGGHKLAPQPAQDPLAHKAARYSPPRARSPQLPGQERLRPLCGDTMTYWDRVNFYNTFAESCGGNRSLLASAVQRK